MRLYNIFFYIVGLLRKHLCVSLPEYVITELSLYVVLDFLSFNSLLHSEHLRRAVGEAARKHVEQSVLHMKTLILAPVKQ